MGRSLLIVAEDSFLLSSAVVFLITRLWICLRLEVCSFLLKVSDSREWQKGTRGLKRREYEQQHDRGWQVDPGRKKTKRMLSEGVLFGTGMRKLVGIEIVSTFSKSSTSKNTKQTPQNHPKTSSQLDEELHFQDKTQNLSLPRDILLN